MRSPRSLARPERAALLAAVRLGLVLVAIVLALIWWVLQKQPDFYLERRVVPDLTTPLPLVERLSRPAGTRSGVRVEAGMAGRWTVTVPGEDARLRFAVAAPDGPAELLVRLDPGGEVRRVDIAPGDWRIESTPLPTDPGRSVVIEVAAEGGALVVGDMVVESQGRAIDETAYPVMARTIVSDLLATHTLDLVRAPPTFETARVNMPGPRCLPVRASEPRILEMEAVPPGARLAVVVHLGQLSTSGVLPPTTLTLTAEGRRLVSIPVDQALAETPEPSVHRELEIIAGLRPWFGSPLAIEVEVAGGQNLFVGLREAYMTAPGEQARRKFDPEFGINVLLVIVDGLRADRLGCAGYGRGSTPSLDALARNGLRYERVLAPSSWALPNVASLVTGVPPVTHGLGLGTGRALSGRLPTLGRSAAWAGYTTAWFGNGGLPEAQPALADGYERVDVRALPAASFVESFDDWLADASQFEWFATVHLTDPTWPHDPAPSELTLVDPEPDPDLVERLRSLDSRPGAAEALAHEVGTLYDAEVAGVDRAVGGLVEVLRRRELLERTLVVVVGSVGQEFYEHGGRGEAQTLFDEVLTVPLILAGPPVPVGVVEAETIELVDVTLLVGQLGHLLVGGNLPGRVPPPFGPSEANRVAHAVLRPHPGVTSRWLEASRRGTFVHVTDREQGTSALYDLAADPGAFVDLLGSGASPEVLSQADGLAGAFEEWYEEAILTAASRAEPWRP